MVGYLIKNILKLLTNKRRLKNVSGTTKFNRTRHGTFGFLDDGINEHEETAVDEYGDVWHVVRKGM